MQFDRTKQFGLVKTTKPQPNKPLAKKPSIFGNDDDDDTEEMVDLKAAQKAAVNRMIMKGAASTSVAADAKSKQAVEEDPSIFDYDASYDSIQEERRSKLQSMSAEVSTKPKYIENLLEQAEIRKREFDIVKERMIKKEQEKEDHLYGDKEKFITAAYKRKLQENEKWLAQQKEIARKEEEEFSKRKDLKGFYSNLLNTSLTGSKDQAADSKAKEERNREESSRGDGGDRRSERDERDREERRRREDSREEKEHRDSSHDRQSRSPKREEQGEKRRSEPETILPTSSSSSSSSSASSTSTSSASSSSSSSSSLLTKRPISETSSSSTPAAAPAPPAKLEKRADEATIDAARQRYLQRKQQRQSAPVPDADVGPAAPPS